MFDLCLTMWGGYWCIYFQSKNHLQFFIQHPTESQSYQTLFSFIFQSLLLSWSVWSMRKNSFNKKWSCLKAKMEKLCISKENSFVRLAPGCIWMLFLIHFGPPLSIQNNFNIIYVIIGYIFSQININLVKWNNIETRL